MPIYDYHCDHCGHTFSAVQSYTDATLEICPSCGKKPRKLMATPAIVFKGGGWYKTDSRVAPKDNADGAGKSGTADKQDKQDKQDKDKKDRPAASVAPADGAKTADASTAAKPAPAAAKGETASS